MKQQKNDDPGVLSSKLKKIDVKPSSSQVTRVLDPALEEYDPTLFNRLSAGPANARSAKCIILVRSPDYCVAGLSDFENIAAPKHEGVAWDRHESQELSTFQRSFFVCFLHPPSGEFFAPASPS
ncbi:MAG TPA: hypothetical protein VM912_20225 [Terriglobales bacterium]|nr:hypothetical protein [Terriglobales bacterium]